LSITDTDIGHRLDRDPVDGRFRSKHRDLRLARLARIKQRLDQLCATYDTTSPGDLSTLCLVAQFYADAEAARSRISRVRCVNAAVKLLKTLRRKPEPPPPTLAEMLAADDTESEEQPA
jgi:hypothetical protein